MGSDQHQVAAPYQSILLGQHRRLVRRKTGMVIHTIVHQRPARGSAHGIRQRPPKRQVHQQNRRMHPKSRLEPLQFCRQPGLQGSVHHIPIQVDRSGSREVYLPDVFFQHRDAGVLARMKIRADIEHPMPGAGKPACQVLGALGARLPIHHREDENIEFGRKGISEARPALQG